MSRSDSLDRRAFLIGSAAGVVACANGGRAEGAAATRVHYGIVAVGTRGRNTHLRLVTKSLPEAEVVALCDVTKENLDQALQACPSAKGYGDYRKMLASEPALDAVIVVVPNFLHAEITIAALQAGKHVLVEKPMATHLADADRMIRAAQEGRRVLQVGQQSRYNLVFQRMAQLIREGAIGDVEYVAGGLYRGDWNPRSWRYRDPATGQETNWRFLTKTAGSSLLEDGIHELDVIHWMVGAPPRRIQAQGGNSLWKDRETIDNAGLVIEYANGARCVFGFTLFTPGLPNNRAFRVFGSKAELSIESAERGERQGSGMEETVMVRPYRGQVERIPISRLRPEEAAMRKEQLGQAGDNIESLRQHQAFVASIRRGEPVFADGQVGKDAAHIGLAAERSLRTGKTLAWSDEVEL